MKLESFIIKPLSFIVAIFLFPFFIFHGLFIILKSATIKSTTKFLIHMFFISGIIVFHEYGHFIAAECSGMTPPGFSLGFGPVLIHKNINGTDYRLSAIPLGGYTELDDKKMANIPQINKFFIASAGVTFNLILALPLFLLGGLGIKKSFKAILEDLYMNMLSLQSNFSQKAKDKIATSGLTSMHIFSSEYVTMANGWQAIPRFLASFSVGLAFFNYLPIPGLDGWHALMAILYNSF